MLNITVTCNNQYYNIELDQEALEKEAKALHPNSKSAKIEELTFNQLIPLIQRSIQETKSMPYNKIEILNINSAHFPAVSATEQIGKHLV